MQTDIIQLKHIEMSYSGRLILKDIDLSIKNGEFLTILGPSGCGKTTLLRLISGFEQPDKGQIFLKDEEVTTQPPQARDVHTVFQSYALFPHLSLFDNVAFGLRCKGTDTNTIESKVIDALKMVRLDHMRDRLPSQLSGGQKQRVAIARAIVNEPLVLLLDEPLSALDYRLRKNMQVELKQLQRKLGITFVFITHDQEEALSMSDRVVVMNEGYIEQIGTPREVYEEPCNLTVGRFIGEVNQFDGQINRVSDEELHVDCDGLVIPVETPSNHNFEVDDRVHILIRPEDIKVWHHAQKPDLSPLMKGQVTEVIYKGSTVDIRVTLDNDKQIITTQFFDEDSGDENLQYKIGEQVWVHWPIGWEVTLPHED